MKKHIRIFLILSITSCVLLLPWFVFAFFRYMEDRMVDAELVALFRSSEGKAWQWKAKEIIYDYNQVRRALLVRHDYMCSDREIRQQMKQLKKDIEMGLRWKSPLTRAVIPLAKDPNYWQESALVWHGEYPLSSEEKKTDESVWKLAYTPEHLYFSGYFPDDFIQSEKSKFLYKKDVFELFIMPEECYCTYVELIFSPDGRKYTQWVHQTKRSRFELSKYSPESLEYETKQTGNGWVISGRIAFRDLPGYLRGNPAESGDTIRLMMLRFDYGKDGVVHRFTPVPFLYDGHNIFGYMKLTLQ